MLTDTKLAIFGYMYIWSLDLAIVIRSRDQINYFVWPYGFILFV